MFYEYYTIETEIGQISATLGQVSDTLDKIVVKVFELNEKAYELKKLIETNREAVDKAISSLIKIKNLGGVVRQMMLSEAEEEKKDERGGEA